MEQTFKNYKEKQRHYENKSKEFKTIHVSNEIHIKDKGTKNERTIIGKGITYHKPKDGESNE